MIIDGRANRLRLGSSRWNAQTNRQQTCVPRSSFSGTAAHRRSSSMIHISKSETADTRTCDFSTVTKETLLASSKQHIRDVREAHQFFSRLLAQAMIDHDTDKLT